MDYWKKDRFTDYFLTMANAEANELISVAKTISLIHLNDGFVRMEFQDNVQAFINAQMGVIRSGDNDKVCQECIQNLKQEREYLTIQDRMLRSGQAAIHTSIKLVKNGEIWGYIINGIGVVLSGLQVAAGVGFMATLNPAGIAFGAMLTLHGLNSIQESVDNIRNKTDDNVGFLKDGYIITAEFLGFDRSVGEIAYNSMDISLSAYGIFKLTLKPQAWRLFYYLNSDYVRNFRNMSSLDLGIEIYNDSNSIKSIYESSKNKN